MAARIVELGRTYVSYNLTSGGILFFFFVNYMRDYAMQGFYSCSSRVSVVIVSVRFPVLLYLFGRAALRLHRVLINYFGAAFTPLPSIY